MHLFDARFLLSQRYSVYGVHTKRATISHPQAEIRCFADQVFTVSNVFAYFYDVLTYRFTVDALNPRGILGDCAMMVSCDQFQASAIKRQKKFPARLDYCALFH